MRLHDFIRSVHDSADSCYKTQKDRGLRGAAVKNPDVSFFFEDREIEMVEVKEEEDDVVIEFRRTV
jgi:hypothetical protein